MRRLVAITLPLLLAIPAAAQELPVDQAAENSEIGSGMASYYGRELAGNRTASGERFDPAQLTAAHRTLPFGSLVRVTNTANGDSVVVRINDRGPFSHGRVIDVSHAAAREIGMHRSGTARVKLALLNDD
ncbi:MULTISPECIES: septal ring lytic transglycosylase RlpA family protein [unclassified Sphingopyxis]|jgi:rare lipoprotein A|uniref:septal ring lytic transglycosylase RlpA family protein n=1 Tax=unclassified Sphingopyxis TaxID=2614943 RepID=UPI0025CE140C|nr:MULTISPECIES: septal ring lytic transglycosylase RlpA family protein [unclassified Sphingopyxis]HEV7342164.1 septal ring lytic transglycosylase RlpA family protein [Sphingopyxis sp.]